MDCLQLPKHFDPGKADKIFRVDYQDISNKALSYQKDNSTSPSSADKIRTCLVLVDVQNTFCIPGFELFVSGISGRGAVDDNIRLCRFIYRNIKSITHIIPTMDTHFAMQIFHQIFFIDKNGNHPEPMTIIKLEDLISKKYRVNPEIIHSLHNVSYEEIEKYVKFYVESLKKRKKYDLIIWPYHAILGGIGHSLVSIVEEAVFFHNIARYSQSSFEVKGSNPLSENYSIFNPEVFSTIACKPKKPSKILLEKLMKYDRIIFAGQAKSHCVAWTLGDLMDYIIERDLKIADKVYILEDCTSPVVVPGIIDFSQISETIFDEFKEFGFNMINSETLIDSLL